MPTRLVDAESILNVPINLFYDLINIPANELDGLQELANALLFGGPWLVESATNLWGIDVGDPPKIDALTEMLFPFQALAEPLSQQFAGFMEAEFPTSPDCASFFCFGGVFNLVNGWLKVPLSTLESGYKFDPSAPGSVDPSGAVTGEFGFPGTQTIDGAEDLYPWAGTTFTLNLSEPFTEFWDSLLATPSSTPIEAWPNVFEVFTKLAEGVLVAVDPFLPEGIFDSSAADSAAAVGLSADSSALLSGLDVADPVNIGGLGAEISAMLPEHLASVLAGLF